jgi:hypothetical protein
MKRQDVQVGAELYYDRRQDWNRSATGKRAVVVEDGLWIKPRISRFRHGDPRPVRPGERGGGVLVDLYPQGSAIASEQRFVVPLSHLHGPYWETLDQLKAADKARDEARAAADTERNEARRLRDALIARAESYGLQPTLRALYGVGADPSHVALTLHDLAVLLDAAADKLPRTTSES